MWVWGKHEEDRGVRRWISQAAAEEAPRDKLIECAVERLLVSSGADRIGVWLEHAPAHANSSIAADYRGIVADRSGETAPAAWAQFVPAATLPNALVAGGQTIEQDLDGPAPAAMIGPLLEMRRALWVPISKNGHLRGVILAGNRKGSWPAAREPLECAAADLLLAFDLEDQRRLARQRQESILLSRDVLAAVSASEPPDAILTSLAERCTQPEPHTGAPGAVFAAIGELAFIRGTWAGQDLDSQASQGAETGPVHFRWVGGDPVWARSLDCEPLAGMWRRALHLGNVLGNEPGVSLSRGEVERVLAIPLNSAGESIGVLVAGLARSVSSLAALERVELCASLAAFALQHRRRTAEAAQLAASRFALLEVTSDPLLLVGPGGEVSAMSAGVREILGETAAPSPTSEATPSITEHFVALLSPHDRQAAESWLRQIASATASDIRSIEVELRNGIRALLRASAANGAVAIHLESLRARQPNARDVRAEAELDNVLEWLEEGVVLFDQRNAIRAMNTRFAQIAGLAPGEAPKISTLDELVTRMESQAADPAVFGQRWRESARGAAESGVREEVQLLRPVARILERASRPVLDREGRSLGRVEIYHDLTGQRVFESKLLQTEKLAALGQMVGGIAHELSNPLTTILGYAQRLLLLEPTDARSREIRQIFQEAERATGILKQLLTSARESRPERRQLSMNQVVSRALELQRFGLSSEKIRVQLDLAPVLPFVLGDTGQLQQVLMNLMANARQAIQQAGKGGIVVVRTRRAPRDTVLLEVSDDGPGIPEAIQARIFDPFFTTKPAGIGTGLGLAVVLGIIRDHGGRVRVANVPGGGAAFTIELPAATSKELTAARSRQPSPEWQSLGAPALQASPPLRNFRGARVLVVEDEPTVARLIAEVLEDEGLIVDLLLDGRDALQRAASETYDLAICDMKMPGLDGQHFHSALVRAGNPLAERFLFVTGDVLRGATRDFLQRHRLPHLAKPFRIDELTQKVQSVLSGFRSGQTTAEAPRSNVART